MGRSREFDESKALTGAMEAFRRRGYAGVSIKDLEDATGLKSGSIYNSFADKPGLFAAACAQYNRVVLHGRIAQYAPESSGIDGLRKLFLTLLDEPGGGSYGCLITNSAIEFGGDNRVPPAATEGLQILAKTFERRLQAAVRAGQVGRDISPKVVGVKLLALYQGILVLIRAGWDKRTLKMLINDEFARIHRQSL